MGLRVTQYGEGVLHEKGEKITQFDGELKALAEEMLETMHKHEGIGLAAQQIGKAIRLCVVELGEAAHDTGEAVLDGRRIPPAILMPLVLVNPRIELPTPVEMEVMEEGCLSFRQVRGNVTRPIVIEVFYQDLEGVEHHLVCEGLLSRCIQHEVDHLNGILFIDRMEKADFARIRSKVRKLKRLGQADDPLRANS
ncbi:peptide deformylase [Puniceicoccus vermicola]|uniref:Peptide deformylase n=1 Tax=Puniceicoccus vermicola TaxID=388746 RepID=A0A7X1E3F8_9BACT|nr:peptide deformylase [Puniceicoccus vermicola]MBC2601445.1 peptide deformylase [Puniceicoccus vermicola]